MKALTALSFLILVAFSGLLAAETLRIPLGQQEAAQAQPLPATGTSKKSVKATYGEPQAQTGPVGEPAIYTWHYQDFSVYFENDRVIHSVVKFTPKTTTPSS
jgi:hypothetical protein